MAATKTPAECRYHEALATLIKDLNEVLAEDWDMRYQSREEIKRKISAAIANSLRIAI